jgi:hypothetical protein
MLTPTCIKLNLVEERASKHCIYIIYMYIYICKCYNSLLKLLNIGDYGCNLEKLRVGSMTTLWPLSVLIATLPGFGQCNIEAQKKMG